MPCKANFRARFPNFPGGKGRGSISCCPQKSLFIQEQNKASASVVLTLKRGQKLDAKQLQGIVNLVAMSVEGLTPERITITDTTGQSLYQPRGDGGLEGMSTSQFEYKNTFESNLENRIEQLLTPIVGPGRALVKANVDLDFSQRTIHKELYDPNVTVVRSEQKNEETTSGSAAVDGSGATTSPRGGARPCPTAIFVAKAIPAPSPPRSPAGKTAPPITRSTRKNKTSWPRSAT